MEFPFNYDPLTGVVTWRNGPFAGRVAGHINDEGYHRLEWGPKKPGLRRRHPAAVVIWAMMTGEWPTIEVDHANRNPLDNRWANLRLATRSEQTQNRVRKKDYPWPVGVKRRGNRFQAAIAIEKKWMYLGMFATAEDAHRAYLAARERLHPRRPDD